MPRQQQGIDIRVAVYHAVLADGHGFSREAHGGETVILRYDDVTRFQHVDECEIDTVGALGNDDGFCARLFKHMGCVAEDDAFYLIFLRDSNRLVHHRVSVRVKKQRRHNAVSQRRSSRRARSVTHLS